MLFILSIICAIGGRAYCSRVNDNYEELLPESFLPDSIFTVLHHEVLQQIYVCYNDSNRVNVYTEDGDFLWSVGTPYLRNSRFELMGDVLVIYDGDAYLYSADNGSFKGVESEEKLDLSYAYAPGIPGNLVEGEFYFDNRNVYRAGTDGELEAVVERPLWHELFYDENRFPVIFICVIGFLVTAFIVKRCDYSALKGKDVFKEKRAEKIASYLRITSYVHVGYAVLVAVSGALSILLLPSLANVLFVTIIPMALHLIVSSIVLWPRVDKMSLTDEERTVIDYREAEEIATFVLAFFALIVIAFFTL